MILFLSKMKLGFNKKKTEGTHFHYTIHELGNSAKLSIVFSGRCKFTLNEIQCRSSAACWKLQNTSSQPPAAFQRLHLNTPWSFSTILCSGETSARLDQSSGVSTYDNTCNQRTFIFFFFLKNIHDVPCFPLTCILSSSSLHSLLSCMIVAWCSERGGNSLLDLFF